MKQFRKVLGIALVAGMALTTMDGCTAEEDRYYYCTEKNHPDSYIMLHEGSTSNDTGSGKAFEARIWGVNWDWTGNFTYDVNDVLTITSGIYKRQTISDITVNFNASVINIDDINYKYRS